VVELPHKKELLKLRELVALVAVALVVVQA
jgi:hypothetical protein